MPKATNETTESAPVAHALDTELIALGEQFEPLVRAHFDATCDWAPRLCGVHRTVRAQFPTVPMMADPRRVDFDALHAQLGQATGAEEAAERMREACDAIEPLANRILALPATTVAGLRAKALLCLFEARPSSAAALDAWDWPDDGGAFRSLFDSVAELAGITPMVREYEARFDQVAADIEAAEPDDDSPANA